MTNTAISHPRPIDPKQVIVELDLRGATRQEVDQALCDLFSGLTLAVRRGCQVDLADPRRIVVTKPSNEGSEP